MGHQQLMLLILGIVLVGVALAAGIAQLGAKNIQANKAGVGSGLSDIAASAFNYRNRTRSEGGGDHSYKHYIIPSNLAHDDYGDYSVGDTLAGNDLTILARSSFDSAWVAICLLDSTGRTSIEFRGW